MLCVPQAADGADGASHAVHELKRDVNVKASSALIHLGQAVEAQALSPEASCKITITDTFFVAVVWHCDSLGKRGVVLHLNDPPSLDNGQQFIRRSRRSIAPNLTRGFDDETQLRLLFLDCQRVAVDGR